MANWDVFREEISQRLAQAPMWININEEAGFNRKVETLTSIIQETIETKIPTCKPNPLSKRWWTKALDNLKKEGNHLSRTSYKYRALPDHHSHRQYKEHRKEFADAILRAKRQHWEDFLEEATEREIWIANKFIKEPIGDGGRPRIPTLKINMPDGPKEVSTNEEKAKAIATSFFPPKPTSSNIPNDLLFVLVILVIKHFEIGLVDIDLYIDFAVFRVFGQYFVNNFSYKIAINIIVADSFSPQRDKSGSI